MGYSPEYRLLLLSLRADGEDDIVDEAVRIIKAKEPDWQAVFHIAGRHAVRPQLARLLIRLPDSAVPCQVKEQAEHSYRQNLTDQIRHVTDFQEVGSRLEDAGIGVVPYKGFWLAESFYGNLADREAGDIDVFVNYRDLGRIIRLMPQTGYLPGEPFLEQPDPLDCEYNFGRYVNGRCVSHFEFHWRIAPARFGLDISLGDLEDAIETGHLQGHQLKVFNTSATLLLTVMHHGGKDSFMFLKQVYDIAMIIRSGKEIDFAWLEQKTRDFHCRRLLLVSLKLAALVTGLKVPAQFADAAGSRQVTRLALDRRKALELLPSERRRFIPMVSDWLFRIRSREGPGVKADLFIRFVRKVLMPRLVPKSMRRFFTRKYVIPEYAR